MKNGLIVIFLVSVCVLASCKNEEQQTPQPLPLQLNTDSLLYAKSKEAGSFNWYRQNDSIQRSSPQSPHSKYFRVRFNNIAQGALTESGRLPQNGSFPQGSLIVKELYDSSTAPLKFLAILYKDQSAKEQANGWVWLEIKGNGDQYISSSEKGAQCVSCHSSGRDHIRLFDLF